MDRVEDTIMSLTVGDGTHMAHLTSTGDKNDVASVQLDEVPDFVLLEV